MASDNGNTVSAGSNNSWRSWVKVTQESKTGTKVKYTVKGGDWVKYTFNITNGVKGTLSCTGHDSETWSGLEGGSSTTAGTTHTKASFTVTYTRGHSDEKKTAKCVIKNTSGYGNGTSTASVSFTVPAKPSYKVIFNGNGGGNVPGAQTKWYGENLTLSGTWPTREGYNFAGWSGSDGGTYWPGGTYGGNGALTLTAMWNEITYTLSFDANGGSNAPGAQTKYYTSGLTISSQSPSRDGHDFKGWSTSSGGGAEYQPGWTWWNNWNATLYAVWQAQTHTYTYNANGGTGAPANSLKTWGQQLYVSAQVPSRTYYNFKGWALSSTATTADYQPGNSYWTDDVDTTLYAVWELAYVKPTVTLTRCQRTDESGEQDDDGQYITVVWTAKADTTVSSTNKLSSVVLQYSDDNGRTWATHGTYTSTSEMEGPTTVIIDGIDTDKAYQVRVVATDTYGPTVGDTGQAYSEHNVPTAIFAIDFLKGGKGVTVGGPAKEAGFVSQFIAEFKDQSIFNGWAKFFSGLWANKVSVEGKLDCETLATGTASVDNGLTVSGSASVAGSINHSGLMYNGSGQEVINANQGGLFSFGYGANQAGNETRVYGNPVGIHGGGLRVYGDCTVTGTIYGSQPQKVLWQESGGWHMTAEHIATLSEPVSSQATGIVLVWWYYYNGTAYNWFVHNQFIPKWSVANHGGEFSIFLAGRADFGTPGMKDVTVSDTQVVGIADNNKHGTWNGLTYDNRCWVLKYIIGV